MADDMNNIPDRKGGLPDCSTDGLNYPEPIRILLLLGVSFFISWGPGLQKIIRFNISRLFPVLAGATVIYCLIFARSKFRSFPLPYNLFFIFTLFHTAICYLIFHPGELTFGYSGQLYSQSGYILLAASRGIMAVRFFLFFLLSYAVGSLLKNKRELSLLIHVYGLGFSMALLLGSHKSIDAIQGFARATGGFLSPNSLGLAAMVCCFLNLAIFLGSETSSRGRKISLIFILTGIYGMLASVSRNTIVAFACGVMVVTIYLPLIKKARWAIGLACLLVAATALLPGSIFKTLAGRMSIRNITESNWSMRGDIWSDYLREGGRYIITGVGLDRSVEVVRDTYTTDTDQPVIPHQTYLQILVEFGFLGLILFLAAFWALIKRGLRLSSMGPEGRENAAMLGLLVSLAVFGMTGSILGERSVWLALGVVTFIQTHSGGNP